VATGIIPGGGTLNQIVRHVGQTFPLPPAALGVLDIIRGCREGRPTAEAAGRSARLYRIGSRAARQAATDR